MAINFTIGANRKFNINTKEEHSGDVKRAWINSDINLIGKRTFLSTSNIEYLADLKRVWSPGGIVFQGKRDFKTNNNTNYYADIIRIWTPGGLTFQGRRKFYINDNIEYLGDTFRIVNVTLENFNIKVYITRRILQPPGVPWLQTDVTTVAWCWKLTLQDGTILGFTNHDNDLHINNITYEASSGFEPTTVDTTSDMSTDNLEVSGVIDSERIIAKDIANGRFDFAEVEIFLCNWMKLTDPIMMLRRGTIGRISHGKNGFQAEIRGLLEAFQQTTGLLYQKQCRAQFADDKCKLSKGFYTFNGTITSISPEGVFTTNLTQAEDFFSYGIITFLRTGEQMEVKKYTQTGGEIMLFLPVLDIKIGDDFSIVAGCDGNLSTCKTRFNNVINFRAEPFIPGNDLMVSYPGKQDCATITENQAGNVLNLKWGG